MIYSQWGTVLYGEWSGGYPVGEMRRQLSSGVNFLETWYGTRMVDSVRLAPGAVVGVHIGSAPSVCDSVMSQNDFFKTHTDTHTHNKMIMLSDPEVPDTHTHKHTHTHMYIHIQM
eukprot:GHVR01017325.1.p2 GENE.GHVR01017325.1~~GHVR01017325.1.p2  ORF type:complete len:115 (-),score=48.52 GHVR01017325.1:46-390(-)